MYNRNMEKQVLEFLHNTCFQSLRLNASVLKFLQPPLSIFTVKSGFLENFVTPAFQYSKFNGFYTMWPLFDEVSLYRHSDNFLPECGNKQTASNRFFLNEARFSQRVDFYRQFMVLETPSIQV